MPAPLTPEDVLGRSCDSFGDDFSFDKWVAVAMQVLEIDEAQALKMWHSSHDARQFCLRLQSLKRKSQLEPEAQQFDGHRYSRSRSRSFKSRDVKSPSKLSRRA